MEETNTELRHSVKGFDPSKLFRQGINLGSIDLIQGGSFTEIIGRVIPSLWMNTTNKSGKSPFSGISIILPPTTSTRLTPVSVLQSMASGILAIRGSEPDSEELKILKRIVNVVNCSTLEVTELVRTAENEGRHRLMAIAEASKYRDQSITLQPVFGVSAIRTSEDLWAQHVTLLCRQCVSIANKAEGYALIHVADIPATRPENVKLLCSVDNCFVTCVGNKQDPEEIINQRAQKWLSMVLIGKTAEAVVEIDQLKITDVDRLHILVQLFQSAGKNEETLDHIEQMKPHLSALTSAQLVGLSRLAHKAGDDCLARSLLPEDISNISEKIWIEAALELATHFEDNVKIEHFDASLALLYPNSDHLRENRDRRLLLNCSRGKLDESYLFTTAGFTNRHLTLLESISLPKSNYQQIIQQADGWGTDWQDLAKICSAMNAWSVGLSRDAADIASIITTSDLYGRQATQILLSSLRTMMLKEEIEPNDHDYYRAHLLAAIHFQAKNPDDGLIRSGVSKLLSVESCGDLGLPIVALTMLDLASEGVSLATPEIAITEVNKTELDTDSIELVIKKGLAWLSNEGTAEFGVTVLPAEIVGSQPDDVIKSLSRIFLYASSMEGENLDLAFMEQLVSLVCAICPHATKERNEDLRLIRLLAGHYAMQGQFQHARNITEHLLLMGQGDKVRLRLAWLAFADVYHRCHNPVTALVGLACAMATKAPIKKADLWQEVYAAIRILRDLGLFEYARNFLPTLKVLISDCGFNPETDLRIVTTELGLRMSECEEASEIGCLMEELTLNCERATIDKNELFPITILLGQIIRKASNAGILVTEQTNNVLQKALSLLGHNASELVETVSINTPSPIGLAKMFNRVQRASYAKDSAGDYTIVGLAARRLLDCHALQTTTPDVQALAVEILADHTMVLPGEPQDIEAHWPVRYAQSLNKENLDVVFLATDSNDELVVTYVSKGEVKLIEQPRHSQPFRKRMFLWLEDYPRNYGYREANDGNNDFFTTMEKLDVCLPAPHMLVVVATPMLQQLITNLVLVESDDGGFPYFLGTKTAVGMVPSLTWLSRVRTNIRSEKRAYKAWISAPDSPQDSGSLGVILTRLSSTFKEFGFTVDTGQRLPRNMSDAGLAVVTAHGGLTIEGRYFHTIKDEGNLIEAPSQLALALAGVEVVILFVCSGGRIDKHPWDNRAVGLPKQLLDKGCRTVIASPWPLDVMVTYRWLEPFLHEWEAGSTVLLATKKANESVARALGDSPQNSLAMTVYGDVLLTK